MKKSIYKITFLLFTLCNLAQEKTNIDPKGNLYFGAEIGSNKITSLKIENKNSITAGLLAEYYFARHWSLSSGLKYYDTGVSYFKPAYSVGGGFGGFLSSSSPAEFGFFSGSVISVPLEIKWEFRVYKDFGASLKMGTSLTYETKSEYIAYSSDKGVDFSKFYGSINLGFGFNYFINKHSAIYFSSERITGSTKGEVSTLVFSGFKNTSNQLTSIGYKYTFKTKKP